MHASLRSRGAALAIAAGLATPFHASQARPEDVPPPREVFDCSGYAQPTKEQLEAVGLAFNAAWTCAISGYGNPPFPVQTLNGYGCYCGSGSTGLDTRPVDGYDACCRQHDIDWTAICRNVADPTQPGRGCDCYVNLPPMAGAVCEGRRLTFQGELNACQKACGDELNKQFNCYAQHYADSNYDWPDTGRYRNACAWEHDPNKFFGMNVGPGRPFGGILPSYCRKSAQPIPDSVFGPVVPGSNVFQDGCSCELDDANCSGKVTGCARSAAACRALNGKPGADCDNAVRTCEVNVAVNEEPCAYRDPKKACPCDPPPDAAELCDLDAAEDDPCNPCTGYPGAGGTCQRGVDLLVCIPDSPLPTSTLLHDR